MTGPEPVILAVMHRARYVPRQQEGSLCSVRPVRRMLPSDCRTSSSDMSVTSVSDASSASAASSRSSSAHLSRNRRHSASACAHAATAAAAYPSRT